MVQILRESTSSDVILGKQGWRFLSNGLDSYQGLNPFSTEELQQWTSAVCNMRDWLDSRGIKFYVLLAPDKHTIYPEYLPPSIRRGAVPTRLDLLTASLLEAHIDLIDVRDRLYRAKSTELVYHRTDTHWNGNAGFLAYQVILAQMSGSFPQLRAYPRAYFTPRHRRSIGDLNRLLGLTQGDAEDIWSLEPKNETVRMSERRGDTILTERNDPQLPRMVMLHDSFGNNLIDLLRLHFRRGLYVWEEGFNPSLLEQEHPDLVLFELVERRLDGTWDHPSFASQVDGRTSANRSVDVN